MIFKCVPFQYYPPLGFHNSSLYVHRFCNSGCINTFLLYYVSWSMCIPAEIFLLTFYPKCWHSLSPHCSSYISCVTDEENLFNNQDLFFTGWSVPFFKTFMYNFITYGLQLKEWTINWNFKSIRLRYIKVIWFLFISSSNGGLSQKMKVGIVHFFKEWHIFL